MGNIPKNQGLVRYRFSQLMERLPTIDKQFEIIDAQLVVYHHTEEVTRILRTEDRPRATLMARFNLTEDQASAIMKMSLASLCKPTEQKMRAQHKLLTMEVKGLHQWIQHMQEPNMQPTPIAQLVTEALRVPAE